MIEHSTNIESGCTERAGRLFNLVSKTRLGYKENTELYVKLKANNVSYCNNRLLPNEKIRKSDELGEDSMK